MIASRTNAGKENGETVQGKGIGWVVELLLPGVFTLVLTVCLVHLAYAAYQAQQNQACHVEYAISAFAN